MRALLLDIHGTLLHLVESVEDVYVRIASRHGVHCPPSLVRERLGPAMRVHDPAAGIDFWREVVAEALDTRDVALFDELFAHYARPEAWTVHNACATLLRDAHKRGHPTAIVSNMDGRAHRLLAEFELLPFLDAVILAPEHGCAKPDAALFRIALDRLAVASAVHLGDHPVEDLAAARGIGLVAVDVRAQSGCEQARHHLGFPPAPSGDA